MVSDPGRRTSGLLSTSFNIWRRSAIGDPVLCFHSPMFQVFRTSESDNAVVFSRSDHRAFSEACEALTADEVRACLRNVSAARRTADVCAKDSGNGGEYQEPVSEYLAACLAIYITSELKAVQLAGLLGTLQMACDFQGSPSMKSVIRDAAKGIIIEQVPLDLASLQESLQQLDTMIEQYTIAHPGIMGGFGDEDHKSLSSMESIVPRLVHDPSVAALVEIFNKSPITKALMDSSQAGTTDSFQALLQVVHKVDGFKLDENNEFFVNPSILDDVIAYGPADQADLIATLSGRVTLEVPSFESATSRNSRSFDKTKVLNDLNKTRVPQADQTALLEALLLHGSTSPQFEAAMRKIERIFRSGAASSTFGTFDLTKISRSVIGQHRGEFNSRLLAPNRVSDAVQGKLPDGQRRLSSNGKKVATEEVDVSPQGQWLASMATILSYSEREGNVYIYEASTEMTDAVQIIALTSRKLVQVIIDALKELIRPESKDFKRLLEMQNRGTGPLHESMVLDWLRHAEGLLNSDQAENLFDGIPGDVVITPDLLVSASVDPTIYAYEAMLEKMRVDTPAFRNQEYLRQIINCGSVLPHEIPKHVTPGTGAEIIKLFCQLVVTKAPWSELDCQTLYHMQEESSLPGANVNVPFATLRDVITIEYAMKSATRMANYGHLYLATLPYSTIKDRVDEFGIEGFADWFMSACQGVEKTPGYAGGSKDGVCNPTKNSNAVHKAIDSFRELTKKIHAVSVQAVQNGKEAPSAHMIISMSIQGNLAGITVAGDGTSDDSLGKDDGASALGAGRDGPDPERVKGYETLLALKRKVDSATNPGQAAKHIENYNAMISSRNDFKRVGIDCHLLVNAAGAVTSGGTDHTSTLEQFTGLSPFSQGILDAHRDLSRTGLRFLSHMGAELYKKIKAGDGNLPKGWGKITITSQKGKDRYSVPATANKAFLTANTTTDDADAEDKVTTGTKNDKKNKKKKGPKVTGISKERLAAFEQWESEKADNEKAEEENKQADAMAGRIWNSLLEKSSNAGGEGSDASFINPKSHSSSK